MQKRKTLWIILAAVLVLVAAAVVGLLWIRSSVQKQLEAGAEPDVLSAAASVGSLSATVSGTGTLTNSDAETLTVPDGVKIAKFCVEDGDSVEKGDVLAVADRTSVMQAMAALQDELDELDGDLSDAESDTIDSSITAAVAARVKKVYAASGDSVLDVMYQNGALALLSLDGEMAVDIETDELTVGDAVTVILADGSRVEGRAASVVAGTASVTLTDNGPEYGESVSVLSPDGRTLGSGELYIHSELKVTGYSGTVSGVYAAENGKVYAGSALFTLTDTAYAGQYDTLLEQRGDLTDQMQELLALYADGNLYADFSGTVSGINDALVVSDASADGLAAEGGGARLLLLAWTDTNRAVLVTGADGETLSYQTLDGISATPSASDLAAATLGDAGSITYDGSQTVWDSGGNPLTTLSGVSYGDVLVISTENGVTSVLMTGLRAYPVVCGAGVQSSLAVALAGSDFTAAVSAADGSALSALTVSVGGTPLPSSAYGYISSTGTLMIPAASVTGAIGLAAGSQQSGGQTAGGAGGASASASTGTTAATTTPDYTRKDSDLLTLTPDDAMTVTITIDELDILSLQKGQTAEITLDALAGRSFEGTVTGIDTTGVNSGGATKYTAQVSLDRTAEMLPGMNASVVITLGTTDGVLTIPVAALGESGTEVFVYTAYDENSDTLSGPVDVVTGLSDGESVEITSGLSEGDTVYYRYVSQASTSFLNGGLGLLTMGS